MTTYILAGGNDRGYDAYGKSLAKEVLARVSQPRILSCFFAQPEDIWQDKYDGWKQWFMTNFGGTITYSLARTETFIEQVKHSDVVYIHGGENKLLMDTLNSYAQIETHFKDKIVIGSSAGANYLSKVYYSPSANKVDFGSGILDCLSVVHFGATFDGEVSLTKDEWNDVVTRVKNFGASEKVTLLPEGEFVVFET
jgi:hypothetical protein